VAYRGRVAQNVYDDAEFFDAYGRLPRSQHGLVAAGEWPVLQELLPSLELRRVVDLGCGYGWFCRWAVEHGAASVLGIDLSARMLARARRDTSDERITYARQDLDQVELPASSFDLAYSSLTVHYLLDIDTFFDRVAAALVPGGAFVFSAEHPIYTAPSHPEFVADADGSVTWPVDGYLVEGPRTTDWLAPGVVKQHRTIGTYYSSLRRAGFDVHRLVEWGPTAEQIAAHPDWAVEVERPQFLLVSCTTPAVERR
jgi:SAM-dependent methyltransferase